MRDAQLEAHHDGSELYVPAGMPSLGDVVPVRLRVPGGYGERSVHVRYVHDGEPFLAPARLDSDDGDRWYVAEVPIHNPVTSYRFLVDHPDGYRWINGRGTHHRDVSDAADFRLTIFEPGPDWLRDGVVYQVFPDRFARSVDADDRTLPAWATPAASWDAEPPADGPATAATVYGGDLRGIVDRLDHLERLGVDVLYLTPVFEATSVHRYDAESFDRVDPLLGGNEALAEFSRAVHARGMRIMGDLTTNHTGDGHEWFVRAQADGSSPERDFFYWDGDEHVGWKGMPWLPKLNYASAELTQRMVDGPDSITARWLDEPYGLDGWRVDVANMTGRYGAQDDASRVARLMRSTMAALRPELALVGELSHDPSADLTGDGWHATMNYAAFTRPVWSWLRPEGGTVWELPAGVAPRSASDMVATMREFSSAVPWSVAARQWNLLGSHDTPRIATLLGGDRSLLEVAVGLLVTMPGTPMVFAGDEIGAEGTNGEHARTTMPWADAKHVDHERTAAERVDAEHVKHAEHADSGRTDTALAHGTRADAGRWDTVTFELYRSLLALRRESAALRRGGLRWIDVGPDAVAFLREVPGESILVLAARAPWEGGRLHVDGGLENLYGGIEVRPDDDGAAHLPGEGPTFQVWRLT